MSTATFVSIDQYLHTTYRPDCDYVDGIVEDRNLGTYPHGRLQLAFLLLLHRFERSHGLRVCPELRVRTQLSRFRIPDVCMSLEGGEELFLNIAPFLCVEVLSPEDRMSRVETRLEEYFQMGVKHVWVVDPVSHEAWNYSSSGKQTVEDGVLRTSQPDLAIQLDELFKIAES